MVYKAYIGSVNQVHDGDTLESVMIPLSGVVPTTDKDATPFLGLLCEDGKVFRCVDVRLCSVDAPELHPRHCWPNGKPRPPADVEHERVLAQKAKQFVINKLSDANLQFELRSVGYGEYATRIVATVWYADGHGQKRSLGCDLVEAGLAYHYFGGTKMVWTRDGPKAVSG